MHQKARKASGKRLLEGVAVAVEVVHGVEDHLEAVVVVHQEDSSASERVMEEHRAHTNHRHTHSQTQYMQSVFGGLEKRLMYISAFINEYIRSNVYDRSLLTRHEIVPILLCRQKRFGRIPSSTGLLETLFRCKNLLMLSRNAQFLRYTVLVVLTEDYPWSQEPDEGLLDCHYSSRGISCCAD